MYETRSIDERESAATMEHVDVRGVRIPVLGFGTWQLTEKECQRAVEDALAIGYRHIDTARSYGNAAAVGAAIRASGIPRDEIFIASNVWWEGAEAQGIRAAAAAMLKRLGVEHVDLAYLQWPHPETPLEKSLEGMTRLMEEGAFRRIGVNGFEARVIREALRYAPISAAQVEYHPFLGQDELRRLAQRRELAVVAHTPLARGAVAKSPMLQRIGLDYGMTPEQLAIRWLTQQNNVAVVSDARDALARRTHLRALDFRLDAEAANEIASLARGDRMGHRATG